MKITLFTANKSRHNHLINLLSKNCDELFVIQECSTIFPGIVPGSYPQSDLMKKYFKKVNDAQYKIFGNEYVNSSNKNIKILPIQMGDLNKCSLPILNDFLQSDIFIVFGSSYIKGDLVNFLLEKKTINIHMGVSPYYRGADCNFWSLYDNNPHLVGSTIHLLSKGLDSGPLLYHAMSKIKKNPFEYSMSTVKSAFQSIVTRVNDKTIFDIKPKKQDSSLEIRCTKKIEFCDEVVKDFLLKEVNLFSKDFDLALLKDVYFLNS
tara:strand:- start:531 stop:1319 length:789 start_codon:yes stop_codon:yes gene_type:complete